MDAPPTNPETAAAAAAETSTSSASAAATTTTTTTPTTETEGTEERCWARKRAKAGDVVVVEVSRTSLAHVKLKEGGRMENRSGVFSHDDVIGRRLGELWTTSKAKAKPSFRDSRRKGGKKASSSSAGSAAATTTTPEQQQQGKIGYMRILPPTPETWTLALNHRTQIIYSIDVAFVVFHLDLKPGSVVVETGTGSGSLTLALARAVAPTGHVHTYEFNADRAAMARVDFASLGVSDVVSVTHADAAGEAGFGLDHKADGVFFDLPNPWDAVPNAVRALREDVATRLVSFSPCIEQILRTRVALEAHGFTDVRCFECLARACEPYTFDALHAPPPLWDPSNDPVVNNPAKHAGFVRVPRGTAFDLDGATHTGYLLSASRFPQ